MYNLLEKYRLPISIPLKLESLIKQTFVDETEKVVKELPPPTICPVPDVHNLCEKILEVLKDSKVDLRNGNTSCIFG